MLMLVNSGTYLFLLEDDMDNLISVEEAAKRLGGLSKWTIHAWLSKGKMQRTKVGGRTMIRESELQKVIDDGGKSPAPKRCGARSKRANADALLKEKESVS
jgi:excisionase family DNA binding protein